MSHLPVLQVLIPLLAAPLCLVLRHPRLSWLIALIASTASFIVSILLIAQVKTNKVISYAMGDWAPPWGIEYRIDIVNAFVLLIVSSISTLALVYSYQSVQKEVDQRKLYLLYTGWLIALTGLLGITITGDAFNVFVFLEISSLSSYLIIAINRDRRALLSAFQYLIMGTVGAAFILLGVGLLYQMTGTLNMADLAKRIPDVADTSTVKVAFACFVVGVAIKGAIFPLHAWLIGAYRYAPSAVTVFLAGTATKVSLYILLRFFFTLFGHDLAFEQFELDRILLPLALIGIVLASLTAIQQENIKRLLAFSSVAQLGYMVLGIAITNQAALTGTLLHMFNHALMKAALFMVAGAIFFRYGSIRTNNIAGIGKLMPYTMAAFIVAGLSLIGVPLTAGFISKWYLVLGAIESDLWIVAIIILVSSLMAAVYIWKIVEVAYLQPSRFPNASEEIREAPLSMLVPLYILIAANIWFGLDTRFSAGIAEAGAKWLLRGAF